MQLRYTVQVGYVGNYSYGTVIYTNIPYLIKELFRYIRELLVANEQICFGLSMWCKCEGSIGQNLQIGRSSKSW
ncbi:hypothetical protein RhiirB3_411595 [Rhizophagus irregularis]|nr:hypothetical protein RhiirB3_411595 [Rhizophagus irregularis]